MLDFLRQLLQLRNGDAGQPGTAAPILRTIIHSEILTEIVRTTGTPIDDLILQVVRSLVPKEA